MFITCLPFSFPSCQNRLVLSSEQNTAVPRSFIYFGVLCSTASLHSIMQASTARRVVLDRPPPNALNHKHNTTSFSVKNSQCPYLQQSCTCACSSTDTAPQPLSCAAVPFPPALSRYVNCMCGKWQYHLPYFRPFLLFNGHFFVAHQSSFVPCALLIIFAILSPIPSP